MEVPTKAELRKLRVVDLRKKLHGVELSVSGKLSYSNYVIEPLLTLLQTYSGSIYSSVKVYLSNPLSR